MQLTTKTWESAFARLLVGMLALALGILLIAKYAWAGSVFVGGLQQAEKVRILAGKSVVLRSPKPIERVSEMDPKVAESLVISPHQIYVTAKSAGSTNLILWLGKDDFAIYDVEVSYDTAMLKQRLNEILPEEKLLQVLATHDSLTLSGKVSSADKLAQALALARAYAPEGRIQNLVQVGGVHQVMIEVRVAEMSRSLMKRLGFNFSYNKGGDFGLSTLGGLTQVVAPEDANFIAGPGVWDTEKYAFGPVGLLVAPAVNALFRFHRGTATWTNFIDALQEDGLVKILAEPTLIALSGESASFHAGGEFPIPVPQGDGDITIDYKEFGVRLSFAPTVLSQERIGIKISPEVSELDFSTAVRFTGFVVPGLTTRKASTSVELGNGQSFAIAGLLSENVRESIAKFPFLGDIPILGNLFRSRQFQKKETELVIIATPHLAKPIQADKQPLPTDFYVEPSDAESYLLGLKEGREKNQLSRLRKRLDGDFGHVVPRPE